MRFGIALLTCAACGCAGAPPTEPSRPAPAAALSHSAEAVANTAPTISGEDRCIGKLGTDHVFDLVLDDADGDSVAWEAETDADHGQLHATHGGPVAAGTTVTIVYSPPQGRPDENWITVTARDARGATAAKRLYVKNK